MAASEAAEAAEEVSRTNTKKGIFIPFFYVKIYLGDSMKFKRFKTKKGRLLLLLDIAVIVICLLRCLKQKDFFIEGFYVVKEFNGNPLMVGLLFFYMIWLFFLYILVKNFIILAIYLAYRIPKGRILKQNTKYEVKENLDYYREKFNNITPAEISLLMDLEIETKKDLSASILNLYNKKLLKFDSKGKMVLSSKDDISDLRKSDEELYSLLLNNNLNAFSIKKWKEISENEAIEDGFIIDKNRSKTYGFSNSLMTIIKWMAVMFAAGIIGGAYLVTPPGQNLMKNMDEYEQITKDIEDQDVIINMIKNDKEFKNLTYDLYVGSIPVCLVGTFAVVALFALFSMPIYLRVRMLTYHFVDANDKYKRTSEGMSLVEHIAGMKNFIHDFSNLSQSQKEEVVLWNDFIIYAMILEENDKIIDEVFKIKKIDVEVLDNVNKHISNITTK